MTRRLVGLVLLLLLASAVAPAADIVIVNANLPFVGFNDLTPVEPVGGNPWPTLGAQRLAVFQAAARLFGAYLHSDVPVEVLAAFLPLPCTAGSATLGTAGPMSVGMNFDGAFFPFTWYHGALANSLAGEDLSPELPDMVAIFNVNLGQQDCFTDTPFYLGLDLDPPPGTVDLFAVLIHELGHGLGFSTLTSGQTGTTFFFLPSVWDHFLLDKLTGRVWADLMETPADRQASATSVDQLVWNGLSLTLQVGEQTAGVNAGQQQMYAPSVFRQGSSTSHFDSASSPNLVMEPFATNDFACSGTAPWPVGDGLDLTLPLLQDIGWKLNRGGDFNGDGTIDQADLAAFLLAAGSTPGDVNYRCEVDLNGDGIIDLNDYGILFGQFLLQGGA